MYMCRESIRSAVLDKFNEVKGWQVTNFIELQNEIKDRAEANTIINNLKICDPAVGSGHFLVSALNELIAIKSELNILMDEQGKTLRDYEIKINNDELIIIDENDKPFAYNPLNKESNRVQKTLFNEKREIIENCLFGVDINPNSVKICRLRLWIELLKNAYYKVETNYTELETLPNIDINIKCGNSLLSRFKLDVNLKDAFTKTKYSVAIYKSTIETYKNLKSKEEKDKLIHFIKELKAQLITTVYQRDPLRIKISDLRGQLLLLENNIDLFGNKIKTDKDLSLDKKRIAQSLAQKEQELADKENSKLYKNAFEWRFEFPEVLNDKGEFEGFDVVIGNPPYIRVQDLQHALIDNYKENFVVAHKRIDISILFLEIGFRLLKRNGLLVYITSNQFLKAEYGRNVRTFLKGHLKKNVDYSKVSVFDGLATYVSVFFITKEKTENVSYKLIEKIGEPLINFSSLESSAFNDEPWDFNINQGVKEKLFRGYKTLGEISNFTYGVITGLDRAFLVESEKVNELKLEEGIVKKFIRPQNYKKYIVNNLTYSLIYPYKKDNSIFSEEELESKYPNCYSFLRLLKQELENRQDSRTTIKDKGIPWYSLIRRVDLNEIIPRK